MLRRSLKTSTDCFLFGRSIPAWLTSLVFLSANLGAEEVMGMAASGAKYGIATAHFYWMGAVPAMVFVGVFMMPFYYGSRARCIDSASSVSMSIGARFSPSNAAVRPSRVSRAVVGPEFFARGKGHGLATS